jgi:hypothetical protein
MQEGAESCCGAEWKQQAQGKNIGSKAACNCSNIIHTLEYTILAPIQKNEFTRLGRA